jgi:hypothetical protein
MWFFNTTCLLKHKEIYHRILNFQLIFTLGADFRAALVANCFRGAFPPVDLRAVCFVRAI